MISECHLISEFDWSPLTMFENITFSIYNLRFAVGFTTTSHQASVLLTTYRASNVSGLQPEMFFLFDCLLNDVTRAINCQINTKHTTMQDINTLDENNTLAS